MLQASPDQPVPCLWRGRRGCPACPQAQTGTASPLTSSPSPTSASVRPLPPAHSVLVCPAAGPRGDPPHLRPVLAASCLRRCLADARAMRAQQHASHHFFAPSSPAQRTQTAPGSALAQPQRVCAQRAAAHSPACGGLLGVRLHAGAAALMPRVVCRSHGPRRCAQQPSRAQQRGDTACLPVSSRGCWPAAHAAAHFTAQQARSPARTHGASEAHPQHMLPHLHSAASTRPRAHTCADATLAVLARCCSSAGASPADWVAGRELLTPTLNPKPSAQALRPRCARRLGLPVVLTRLHACLPRHQPVCLRVPAHAPHPSPLLPARMPQHPSLRTLVPARLPARPHARLLRSWVCRHPRPCAGHPACTHVSGPLAPQSSASSAACQASCVSALILGVPASSVPHLPA